ncbi:MAG: CatA-like O-acetyltransferase [Cyclobacteriaceae bacterium]
MSKETKTSFFLRYLHKSLQVVNKLEEFRYRIEEDKVYIYDCINASATINRADGTFGFSYIDYHKEYSVFEEKALQEIERVMEEKELVPGSVSANIIHYSSIPWINFTALSHARNFDGGDSVPKISFGKMVLKETRYYMPVSVHVHHALMDGMHVGQYFEHFERTLSYKE